MTNASCTLLLLSDRSSTVRAMRPRLPKRCCHVGKPCNRTTQSRGKRLRAFQRLLLVDAAENRATHTHTFEVFLSRVVRRWSRSICSRRVSVKTHRRRTRKRR
uniref:Putative secreted protein n=1 Tax=Ixodes ricinus TaxID=34613 RepID=A0A6B0UCP0_IXORI